MTFRRTVVALLAAATVLIAPSTSIAAGASSCPVIVSHKGHGNYQPENTVPAIAAGAASGAEWVEIDVRMSKSEFPVAMHDVTVDRTTNGTGAVSSLWLADLVALWAADYAPFKTDPQWANVKVPYAWEFMNAGRVGDVNMLLDVKEITDYSLDRLLHYINVHGWLDRTLVMLAPQHIEQAQAWEPGLLGRYAVIEYNPYGGGMPRQLRSGEQLRAWGVDVYVVPARDVTPAAVAYWHSYGLEVWTWTTDNNWPDNATEWQRVRDAGVDTIITNHPEAALAWRGC